MDAHYGLMPFPHGKSGQISAGFAAFRRHFLYFSSKVMAKSPLSRQKVRCLRQKKWGVSQQSKGMKTHQLIAASA
ncbi:hypothetical protein [Comamonas suwonensis]|uniref:Uncharacterized protein n=1 Tax=Comamonas suwonensis TaxID=2606214 RepID=A0A843B1T1_9BURK|nr:hypothetical protein [Comamonas suwonensis]MBI1625396.1 hypothetical protein [Comamonas suwonensis]